MGWFVPRILVTFALLVCLRTAASADDLDAGVAAYDRKDYETAFRLLRPLAEQGIARAQEKIGTIFYFDQVPPWALEWDSEEEKDWWLRDAGPNYAEAMRWWRLAAEQGNAEAQHNLGLAYYMGYTGPHDYAEALKWYHLAAKQGVADAQAKIAWMYETGQGVPQDFGEAIRWNLFAAEQSNSFAQNRLGELHRRLHEPWEDGLWGWLWQALNGTKNNYVQAHMWFNLAAAQGYHGASGSRVSVAALMTPSQIDEAQQLARDWLAKHQEE